MQVYRSSNTTGRNLFPRQFKLHIRKNNILQMIIYSEADDNFRKFCTSTLVFQCYFEVTISLSVLHFPSKLHRL